jgi:hypothetical protein
VQRLTGDLPAAAASHQQALELCRDAGNRLGQAETLNCLGELASRTADGHQARSHHTRALAIARHLGAHQRKHAPWKASATATSATATPLKPPPHYGMRSRSTSAPAAPPPGPSRKPCANMGSPRPQYIPPTARNLPVNAGGRPTAHSWAPSNSSYGQMKLHNAALCTATAT